MNDDNMPTSKFAEALQQALHNAEQQHEPEGAEELEADLRELELRLQAVADSKKEFGESHPETATALNDVGSAYLALGDHESALEYYQQALAIRQQVLGEQHPDTAASLSNIGGVYYEMDDRQQALQYGEQALAILREALGESHPDTIQVLMNLCILLEDMGKSTKAFMLLEEFLRKIPQSNEHYLELAKLCNDLRPPGFRAHTGKGKKKSRR